MGKEVVIIHFQPLELYPPVMNLLSFIAKEYPSEPVTIFTTSSEKGNRSLFTAKSERILIKRMAKTGIGQSSLLRYWNYLLFYGKCCFYLLKIRPGKILYFETLSSYPVWLYKKFFRPDVPVFIHYHEYTSPAEYAAGMKMNRYFHKKEKEMYRKTSWISHTNRERMTFFLADVSSPVTLPAYLLPNYPSRDWARTDPKQRRLPVRVVYVGALSMDTMYTEAFANWVADQGGRVIWHIYSTNISSAAAGFLLAKESDHIRLLPGVDYEQLPALLERYDVGVILYNGHIPNYVYNAPNKLFEYLAGGLDVWYPLVMKGCAPYSRPGTYPKVLSIDFTDLATFRPEDAIHIDTSTTRYEQPGFFYESVLPGLTDRLFKH